MLVTKYHLNACINRARPWLRKKTHYTLVVQLCGNKCEIKVGNNDFDVIEPLLVTSALATFHQGIYDSFYNVRSSSKKCISPRKQGTSLQFAKIFYACVNVIDFLREDDTMLVFEVFNAFNTVASKTCAIVRQRPTPACCMQCTNSR